MANVGDISAHLTQPWALLGLSESVGLATEQVKGFTGVVQKAFGPFTDLANFAAQFTEAIDPALVMELGRAFRDLQAVVGQAMRPIVDQARELVRYVGGALMPVMKKLAPIIDELSQRIGYGLKKAVSELSDLFEMIEPHLRDIQDVLDGIIDIIMDVAEGLNIFCAVILQAAKELFGAIFGGAKREAKDVMASIRSAIQDAIKALIMFAAQLMKAFGWTKGLEAMIAALGHAGHKPKDVADDRGMAVAQGAMFKAIADLGNSVYASAFQASAFQKEKIDPQQQAADFLKELVADVKGLPNADTLQEMFTDAVEAAAQKAADYADAKWNEAKRMVANGWDAVREVANQEWDNLTHKGYLKLRKFELDLEAWLLNKLPF